MRLEIFAVVFLIFFMQSSLVSQFMAYWIVTSYLIGGTQRYQEAKISEVVTSVGALRMNSLNSLLTSFGHI